MTSMLPSTALRFTQVQQGAEIYLMAGLVPLILGSPGIGKSDLARLIAKKFNLFVIDIRLSQHDPVDLSGFPSPRGEKVAYLPLDMFPLEGDPIPKGYSGWLIFLDELPSAAPATQAAAYKLILDRMIGQFHLHKNVAIIAAGNKETDNAIVHPLSTALQSRFVHLELGIHLGDWLDWAAGSQIDHRITSYLNFKSEHLYTFSPNHTDRTYACPRTWAFTDAIIKKGKVDPTKLENSHLFAGAVSEGVGREFQEFCRIQNELPTLADIISRPETTHVSDDPGITYAMTGFLANHATEQNLGQLLTYLSRMPVEFQVICLRDVVRRHVALRNNKHLMAWVTTTGAQLF